MATALRSHSEFDRARRPVSFEVLAPVAEARPQSLPVQTRRVQSSLIYQPAAHSTLVPANHLQPQHAAAGQTRPAQANLYLQPQLKVTSSVVPAPAQLKRIDHQRGVVKPLPRTHSQPSWLSKLRVAQRCSTVLATGLVAVTLVVYGTTVYTQHYWGSQYGELTRAEKERSLMDAFGESLKQNYAEQASKEGSPLSGQPTPQYKIPLEPQDLRPPIEIPPQDPMANQPRNFPKGY